MARSAFRLRKPVNAESAAVHRAADCCFSLTLRRNCSISPGGLLWLLALLVSLCLGIGAVFAAAGAWMVMPFAVVEMIMLGAAFYLQGRHAGDYERIVLQKGQLVVEVRDGEDLRRSELNPAWVRIAEREKPCEYRLSLLAHGSELVIGRHLDSMRRRELAAVLKRELRAIDGPARHGRAAGQNQGRGTAKR